MHRIKSETRLADLHTANSGAFHTDNVSRYPPRTRKPEHMLQHTIHHSPGTDGEPHRSHPPQVFHHDRSCRAPATSSIEYHIASKADPYGPFLYDMSMTGRTSLQEPNEARTQSELTQVPDMMIILRTGSGEHVHRA